jgi:SEC-C motif-containing protein
MRGQIPLPPIAMPPKKTSATPCPCGQPKDYADCCGVYHGGVAAPTAEALMRSRYSAYALGRANYILATWHASTRPLDANPGRGIRWIGLTIKRHETSDDSALVEFVARYKTGGRAQRLHEVSRFVREHGRWYYVDGQVDDEDGRR